MQHIKQTAQGLASLGRGTDSMLVHMSPREYAGLQQLARQHGVQLTTNPHTGLPEAGSLDWALPVAAMAAAVVGSIVSEGTVNTEGEAATVGTGEAAGASYGSDLAAMYGTGAAGTAAGAGAGAGAAGTVAGSEVGAGVVPAATSNVAPSVTGMGAAGANTVGSAAPVLENASANLSFPAYGSGPLYNEGVNVASTSTGTASDAPQEIFPSAAPATTPQTFEPYAAPYSGDAASAVPSNQPSLLESFNAFAKEHPGYTAAGLPP